MIAACLADVADQFTNLAPLRSSVTRAWRLYRAAGVDIETVTQAHYLARAVTREHQAAIRARQPGADRTAPISPFCLSRIDLTYFRAGHGAVACVTGPAGSGPPSRARPSQTHGVGDCWPICLI